MVMLRVDRLGRIDLTRKGRQLPSALPCAITRGDVAHRCHRPPMVESHDEAERMEHAISPEVEALLLKRLPISKAADGVSDARRHSQAAKQGAVLLSDLRPRTKPKSYASTKRMRSFLASGDLELRRKRKSK